MIQCLAPYVRACVAEGYAFDPDLFAERFGLSDRQRELVGDVVRAA